MVCVLTWSPEREGRLSNVRTLESSDLCPPSPRHLITKLKGSTESHFCIPRLPPTRRVPLAEKTSKGINAVATRGRRSRPLWEAECFPPHSKQNRHRRLSGRSECHQSSRPRCPCSLAPSASSSSRHIFCSHHHCRGADPLLRSPSMHIVWIGLSTT